MFPIRSARGILRDQGQYLLPNIKVQKSLVTIYMTINNSMMTALESAENIIKAAQDKTGDQSPMVKTALEKLTLATAELTKAARKVGGGNV